MSGLYSSTGRKSSSPGRDAQALEAKKLAIERARRLMDEASRLVGSDDDRKRMTKVVGKVCRAVALSLKYGSAPTDEREYRDRCITAMIDQRLIGDERLAGNDIELADELSSLIKDAVVESMREGLGTTLEFLGYVVIQGEIATPPPDSQE
ncbi:MAG: hypothetical protein QXS20_08905 [Candidatus Thorarchaeota archaeon]